MLEKANWLFHARIRLMELKFSMWRTFAIRINGVQVVIEEKTKEIQRLIEAFEKEAGKFHNIKFSVYYIYPGVEDTRFEYPNHTITLWQYFGRLSSQGGPEDFVKNLQESDLEWGIKGAKLTSIAVIEGKETKLFVRMAVRAANIFDKEEAYTIGSRVTDEIAAIESDGASKPLVSINSNSLAIWLNYLLYYLSKVKPGKEKLTRIEPDPFALSLMALEDLLKDPEISKIDKSLSNVENIKFKAALSFTGEKRAYVSRVAQLLRAKLGKDQVFYDYDYQSQLARPDMDLLLQKIYRKNSDLVVVFLCKEYADKQWCGLEWRAIRDIIKNKKGHKVMFIRFDEAEIEGVFSVDGYIDANIYTEEKIAEYILERIALSGE